MPLCRSSMSVIRSMSTLALCSTHWCWLLSLIADCNCLPLLKALLSFYHRSTININIVVVVVVVMLLLLVLDRQHRAQHKGKCQLVVLVQTVTVRSLSNSKQSGDRTRMARQTERTSKQRWSNIANCGPRIDFRFTMIGQVWGIEPLFWGATSVPIVNHSTGAMSRFAHTKCYCQL